jgi:hypothetical protein
MSGVRRNFSIAAGAALVVAVLAIASQVFGPSEPELPTAMADGLPVISVSAAIEARQRLGETDPVAVFGWYSQGPAHSCPAPVAPDGGMRVVSEIELYCHRGEVVLAERAESAVEVQQTSDSMSVRIRHLDGPWLDPYLAPLSIDRGIHPAAIPSWTPRPIVAVGHFRDHRAADCQPADVPFCANVFVIDHVASVDGVDRARVEVMNPSGGTPKATPDVVVNAAVAALGARAEVIGLGNMIWTDVANYEVRAAAPIDGRVVWLVRAIDRGSDGSAAPRLRALLFDDVTLEVLWKSELPTD